MEQKILTDIQEKIITAVVNEPNLKDFYLSGGTALAGFYLFHRLSDDLDFFCFGDPDRMFLHNFANKVKELIGADEVTYEKIYDRSQFYFKVGSEIIKIEFTKYPFAQLDKMNNFNKLNVDSLRDVGANKLMAMLDRFDPKDFVDLYFLMQDFSLDQIKKDAEKKFNTIIDKIFLGGELAKVKRIEALPKMIKNITIADLKDFFEQKAKDLGKEIIN